MANHLTGPHLNSELSRGSREWYKKQPRGIEPDYVQYMNDFLTTRDLDQTNEWVVVKDTGASVAIEADKLNGAAKLASAATTDNDGATLQLVEEVVKLSSGKQVWMEFNLQVSDADQMDVFVGLCDTIATDPENVLTDPDRIGFQINDGNASILCKSESGGTETSTDSGKDAADATDVKLGFYWDGSSSVEFYVDRAKVATHTTNNPTDQNLAITMFELSGDASGTKSMSVDYAYACQER